LEVVEEHAEAIEARSLFHLTSSTTAALPTPSLSPPWLAIRESRE
jgi:hypothetical protein